MGRVHSCCSISITPILVQASSLTWVIAVVSSLPISILKPHPSMIYSEGHFRRTSMFMVLLCFRPHWLPFASRWVQSVHLTYKNCMVWLLDASSPHFSLSSILFLRMTSDSFTFRPSKLHSFLLNCSTLHSWAQQTVVNLKAQFECHLPREAFLSFPRPFLYAPPSRLDRSSCYKPRVSCAISLQ